MPENTKPKKEKLDIDANIVKSATSCAKNKACLENPGSVCPVVSPVSDDLIFVSKKSTQNCSYFSPYGYSGFCKCPVRQEIYKKYKK